MSNTAGSRADLLTLLQSTPVSLRADVASFLGYTYGSKEIEIAFIPSAGQDGEPLEVKTKPDTKEDLSSRKIHQYAYIKKFHLKGRELTTQHNLPLPPKTHVNTPEVAQDLSTAKLQRILDQCAIDKTRKMIDEKAVVKKMSRNQPLKRLPRKTRADQALETILLVDRGHHLQSWWNDQLEMAKRLKKLLGYEGVYQLMISSPHQAPYDLFDYVDYPWDAWANPIRVIVLSDLGKYAGDGQRQGWQELLKKLDSLGHEVVVIAPCNQMQFGVGKYVELDARPSRLAALQQSLVSCYKPSFKRLRHLRQTVSKGCLEDELRIWNSDDVITEGIRFRFKPDRLEALKRIDVLSETQKDKLASVNSDWRDALSREEEAIEYLIDDFFGLGQALASPNLIAEALNLFGGTSDTNASVYRWLTSTYETLEKVLPKLLFDTKWEGLIAAMDKAREPHFAPATQAIQLWQVGDFLKVRESKQQTTPNNLVSVNADVVVVGGSDIVQETSNFSLGDMTMRSSREVVRLGAIQRPSWANRIWQERGGDQSIIYAAHQEGAVYALTSATEQQPKSQWRCEHNPWSWASDTGIDDYGLWADLAVADLTYRLRWIAPGSFNMGSPGNEVDRSSDETLHKVTLSQGYWLGETSCKQDFWLAIMGENPSRFSDSGKLPVDSISWEDVKTCLQQLKKLVPSFNACLPTEAQWEYACRAGVETAYWWGNEFDAAYANRNEEKTVEESPYPTNLWGLKSMSGNVIEWCEDWYNEYDDVAVLDPKGPSEGQGRVLRGGSWFYDAQYLRSASRYVNAPDDRNSSIGFRLAGGLQSVSPETSKHIPEMADRWARSDHRGSHRAEADDYNQVKGRVKDQAAEGDAL